jgi:hypothetical protein
VTAPSIPLRDRLEAHAAACRKALDAFGPRPQLPKDIADELWQIIVRGDRASLDGARLDGARLDGASLVGASLDGASLDGASLVGSDGVTYKLTRGPTRTVTGGRFHVLTAPTKKGRILRFGCEIRTVADWREKVDELCTRHVPGNEAMFCREIRALLAWCESLDADGGAS